MKFYRRKGSVSSWKHREVLSLVCTLSGIMWFFVEFWTGIVFEHDVQSRGVCSKWRGLDGRKHAALGTFSRLNAWRMSKILALLGLVEQSKCMLKSPRIRSLPWWRLLYSRKSRNSVKNRVSELIFLLGGGRYRQKKMHMIQSSECDFDQLKWWVSKGKWGHDGDREVVSLYVYSWA